MDTPTTCGLCGGPLTLAHQGAPVKVASITLACAHCDTPCVDSPPYMPPVYWNCSVCIKLQQNLLIVYSQAVRDTRDTDTPQ